MCWRHYMYKLSCLTKHIGNGNVISGDCTLLLFSYWLFLCIPSYYNIMQCSLEGKKMPLWRTDVHKRNTLASSHILVLNNASDFNFGWSYLHFFHGKLQHGTWPINQLWVKKSSVTLAWAQDKHLFRPK